jgi:DNA-binding NtrC family response regulator
VARDKIGTLAKAVRDWPDDILPLAHLFMREFSEASHRDIKGFTEAGQAMLNHPWPRNVGSYATASSARWLSQMLRIGVDALFPCEQTEANAVTLATLAAFHDRAER